MIVASQRQTGVTLPGVGLQEAADGDRNTRRGAQALGARVVDDAQVRTAQAATRRLLRRDGDQRLARLAAAAAGRSRALAAEKALL